mmetsp:Transcript_13542/g.20903  ORF Transcript_13542/g.20903 Transcript_13542/m.20903 type:complete len:262 (-) Transcript_13542:514-1299(-)
MIVRSDGIPSRLSSLQCILIIPLTLIRIRTRIPKRSNITRPRPLQQRIQRTLIRLDIHPMTLDLSKIGIVTTKRFTLPILKVVPITRISTKVTNQKLSTGRASQGRISPIIPRHTIGITIRTIIPIIHLWTLPIIHRLQQIITPPIRKERINKVSLGTLPKLSPNITLFPTIERVGGIGTKVLCAELVPLGIPVTVITGVFVVDVVEAAFGPDAWSVATSVGGAGRSVATSGGGGRGAGGGGGAGRGFGFDFNPEFIILIE